MPANNSFFVATSHPPKVVVNPPSPVHPNICVLTQEKLVKGEVYGPLKGSVVGVENFTKSDTMPYLWPVFKRTKEDTSQANFLFPSQISHFLDASMDDTWMRFVPFRNPHVHSPLTQTIPTTTEIINQFNSHPSTNKAYNTTRPLQLLEQSSMHDNLFHNLEAFQGGEEIFFRVLTDVDSGTKLVLWLDPEYMRMIRDFNEKIRSNFRLLASSINHPDSNYYQIFNSRESLPQQQPVKSAPKKVSELSFSIDSILRTSTSHLGPPQTFNVSRLDHKTPVTPTSFHQTTTSHTITQKDNTKLWRPFYKAHIDVKYETLKDCLDDNNHHDNNYNSNNNNYSYNSYKNNNKNSNNYNYNTLHSCISNLISNTLSNNKNNRNYNRNTINSNNSSFNNTNLQAFSSQSASLKILPTNRNAHFLKTEPLSTPTTSAYSSSSSLSEEDEEEEDDKDIDVDSLEEEREGGAMEGRVDERKDIYKTDDDKVKLEGTNNCDVKEIKSENPKKRILKSLSNIGENDERSEENMNSHSSFESNVMEDFASVKRTETSFDGGEKFIEQELSDKSNNGNNTADQNNNRFFSPCNKFEIVGSSSNNCTSSLGDQGANTHSIPSTHTCQTTTSTSQNSHISITSPSTTDTNNTPTTTITPTINSTTTSAIKKRNRGHFSLPYDLPRVNGKFIYECKTCGKVCAQLSNLKVHLLTHTGERPFSCHQCPSKFTQKAHLIKHLSTHTGLKPFSCVVCGKKSSSSSNIKAHMKVHADRKAVEAGGEGVAEGMSGGAGVRSEAGGMINGYQNVMKNEIEVFMRKNVMAESDYYSNSVHNVQDKLSCIYLPYAADHTIPCPSFFNIVNNHHKNNTILQQNPKNNINSFKFNSNTVFKANNSNNNIVYTSNNIHNNSQLYFEQQQHYRNYQQKIKNHQKHVNNLQHDLRLQHHGKSDRYFPYHHSNNFNPITTSTPIKSSMHS